MKNLQDRINENVKYFKGLEVSDGYYVVKVQFEEKWGTYNSPDNTVCCVKSKDGNSQYMYYGSVDDTTLDAIFDLIESTIKMNVEAELKVNLMLEKIEELKGLFASESLDKLKTLSFVFKDAKKHRGSQDDTAKMIEAEMKKRGKKKTVTVEPSENNVVEKKEESVTSDGD